MRRGIVQLQKMLSRRYEACMVLGGAGDALGYRNGKWEMCNDGEHIHADLKRLGGLPKVLVKLPDWRVSDDTVMHLATAEALASSSSKDCSRDSLYASIAQSYIECMDDMDGRGPGKTCIASIEELKRTSEGAFWQLPFNPKGGGCGAAMRSACIGLRYPMPGQLADLIAVSVESSRMTHHHPVGYLGGLVAALFTAFAIQDRPLRDWGAALVDEALPLARDYVQSQARHVEENLAAWPYFESAWKNYLELRQLNAEQAGPLFPASYGVKERDTFYASISKSGIGGASGHDSVIIAYDALLGCNGNWSELCERAMLHGGDNDSTGGITGSWFGALYGYESVIAGHHECLEYRERLVRCACKLYQLATNDIQ